MWVTSLVSFQLSGNAVKEWGKSSKERADRSNAQWSSSCWTHILVFTRLRLKVWWTKLEKTTDSSLFKNYYFFKQIFIDIFCLYWTYLWMPSSSKPLSCSAKFLDIKDRYLEVLLEKKPSTGLASSMYSLFMFDTLQYFLWVDLLEETICRHRNENCMVAYLLKYEF